MKVTDPAPVRRSDLQPYEFPSAPPPQDPAHRGENSVVYLQLLWRHRRLLARAVFCGFIASSILAFLIPVRFESTLRLMPPDNNQSGGLAMAAAALSGGAGGLGAIASDVLGLKSSSDIFVGIVSSNTVRDKMIQQFDLRKVYGVHRMEDARAALAARTAISVDRKSQIITITVTDHDPKRATAIGESYVAELNRLVAELSTSTARRERIFLEERLKAVDRDLETAETEFSQFSSKNATLDIKEQGKTMVEAAATLQGQYIAAQSELEGLRQIYSNSNVRVRSVRARIEELRRQVEKLGGKGEQDSEPSAQQADSLYPTIRQLPLLGVTYADLYRRTKVQEAVFESLTKEYELAKVQEVKEIPVVKVLDAPSTPERKSFPPRIPIALFGSAFAFAVAATWVFGKTMWRQMDPTDSRKMFAQEVFSTIKARLPRFTRNRLENHSSKGESESWIARNQEDEVPH